MATKSSECYLPTPIQIAEECLRIQATWSPEERFRRLEGLKDPARFPLPPALLQVMEAADVTCPVAA